MPFDAARAPRLVAWEVTRACVRVRLEPSNAMLSSRVVCSRPRASAK